MFKVTFVYLQKVESLCCKKIEDTVLIFLVLKDIIRDPNNNKDFMYTINHQGYLVNDSFEKFKNRKMIRIPIGHILLVEEFELTQLKNNNVVSLNDKI